jgi:hypothetical protein
MNQFLDTTLVSNIALGSVIKQGTKLLYLTQIHVFVELNVAPESI